MSSILFEIKQNKNATSKIALENAMSHKPTRSKYAILKQICELIPAHLTTKLARKHGVDKKARSFSPWSHLVALFYTQLAHSLSLNDVCDAMRHHTAKLFDIRKATSPSRNGLSYANRNRNPQMAQDLFWTVLDHLKTQCPKFGGQTYKGMPRRFKRTVNAVDATTIQLVANCLDWAKHRRKKAAAKLHLRLDLQTFLPKFVVVEPGRDNDAKHAASVCAGIGAGEIVVFDKAYVDFDHLFELNERGVFWVTRAKDNMQWRCVKRKIKKPNGRILRDDLIVLTTKNSCKKYPTRFRRVVALVELDGKDVEMVFISNNLDWAASSIADLYKSRWNVEVFFKEIKQTLQLCDFLGHNQNAILWQVWTALLLYVLLRYLSFIHSWSHSFKRLFCILRSSIWDSFLLRDLLSNCGTAPGQIPIRASPQQAYLPGFSVV
jgi:hypothetical protein